MKHPVESLQLQGEIIFVADPARVLLSAMNGRSYHSRPMIVVRRIGDLLSNLLHSVCASVVRQISGYETTFAGHHVASRASRFTREDALPVRRIAGQIDRPL